MPAYPMAPMPTYRDFLDRLTRDFGCEQQLAMQRRFLVRNVGGEVLACGVQPFDADECLTPQIIRYVCRRLRVPVEDFGLSLG